MKKFLLLLGGAVTMASTVFAQDSKNYFEEDFEWFSNYTATTLKDGFVDDNQSASSGNLTANADETHTFLSLLQERGYSFISTKYESMEDTATEKLVYLQKNYLKFGKKGYYSGIILPKVAALGDGVSDAKISFDWTPNRRDNGSYDPTKLVIVLTNGSKNEQYFVDPLNIENNTPLKFYNTVVDLKGATLTKDTKITIRPVDELFPAQVKENFRWYVDNIKIYSDGSNAVTEIMNDIESPIEYYNMQGVRIEKPEHGLYITKQGSKVQKIIIR